MILLCFARSKVNVVHPTYYVGVFFNSAPNRVEQNSRSAASFNTEWADQCQFHHWHYRVHSTAFSSYNWAAGLNSTEHRFLLHMKWGSEQSRYLSRSIASHVTGHCIFTPLCSLLLARARVEKPFCLVCDVTRSCSAQLGAELKNTCFVFERSRLICREVLESEMEEFRRSNIEHQIKGRYFHYIHLDQAT